MKITLNKNSRNVKDTKNRITWLCRIAPATPIIATRRRKTPHAITPPMIGKLTSIVILVDTLA